MTQVWLTCWRPVQSLCNINHVDNDCLDSIPFAFNLNEKYIRIQIKAQRLSLSSSDVWNWGRHLSDQTGHLIAVELVWHAAVDVDRHSGWMLELSARWEDLGWGFFGIFCLEKRGWHKRLQARSVSDMKNVVPRWPQAPCLKARLLPHRFQRLRNSSAREEQRDKHQDWINTQKITNKYTTDNNPLILERKALTSSLTEPRSLRF